MASELDAGVCGGGPDGLQSAEFGEPDHDFVDVVVAGAVADRVEEGVVGDVAGDGGGHSLEQSTVSQGGFWGCAHWMLKRGMHEMWSKVLHIYIYVFYFY